MGHCKASARNFPCRKARNGDRRSTRAPSPDPGQKIALPIRSASAAHLPHPPMSASVAPV
ncbi:hypothetical protein C4K04_5795 [Pseudomonas chlororaphis]|uniref:Uncharacterized protein n=1 Tax=Pseudomonas chlororaphis TaxID=587753 RepID=A0A3G7TWD2_9PSED|nr:hypothetical protein C4K04_5795 [Pseudomonas chlororaphis]